MLGFINICHPDYIDKDALQLAEAAYRSLSERIPDVFRVEEIVKDQESALRAAKCIRDQEADGVVLFYSAFVLCDNVMDVLTEIHVPISQWGVPMMERNGMLSTTGSYVAFSMFSGTLERLEIPHLNIVGEPDCETCIQKLQDFDIVCRAIRTLRRSRVGLVGYTSMSIYPGTFDHVFLRWILGPEICHFDSYSLIRRAEESTETEIREAEEQYQKYMRFPADASPEMKKKAAGLYVALKKLCKEQNLCAVTVKCQYEFSKEYQMTPCLPLSLLAEEGIVTSCEGDIPCLISCLLLHELSGSVVSYGDAIHEDGNTIKMSPCGFMPFSLGNEGKKNTFVSTYAVFKGILCNFVMHPGRMTALRLMETTGGYKLVFFTGEALVSELRGGNMPSVDIRMDGNLQNLREHYPGQHFALCYGDLSEKLILFAKLKGIAWERF